jgi:hypothetical protein
MPEIIIPPGGELKFEIEGPAGGAVHLDVEPPRERRLVDPEGGRPIRVSTWVLPDAMATYLLGAAIVDASRAVERSNELNERVLRWHRISTGAMIGLLALASTWLALLILGHHL